MSRKEEAEEEYFLYRYLFSCHGKGGVEPLLKGAAAFENGGQEEVEQRPELRQFVLQGSSSE